MFSFFCLFVDDYRLNSKVSFITLFLYRIENLLWRRRFLFTLRFFLVFSVFFKRLFGVDSQISYKAKIGKRIRLPHKAFGVVISAHAKVGDNVTIYHLVTLGINERKNGDEKSIIIGDGSYLSVGSKIISCKLGRNVKVAPNVVVYYNVDDNKIVKSNLKE